MQLKFIPIVGKLLSLKTTKKIEYDLVDSDIYMWCVLCSHNEC